jgi:hypothetical protein
VAADMIARDDEQLDLALAEEGDRGNKCREQESDHGRPDRVYQFFREGIPRHSGRRLLEPGRNR